ncbi:aminotransferase class I/II-fold pyridoxal phosphate-dependent enzyme [Streptomyces sp. 3MP-14]|uniref:Aminotransferase class I/II-fold pyridoxal phosphate-dependent enzyme n=1 Tax=Streptomyces mimosae TaxID=2586635 RepID=A0A5N6AGC8_9ACTN|nr:MULTISPECIES: DegT/DnrJ/EryC1/StrS family aminotransferase [Streptomyces]KAB8167774.1 aminotransferase class I/II-fold pyridoxal phosphate-dependent enzyme [Streptomyces mimosae]KAB8177578.1 aminotransferase class I/II-fold pyridoxal phosphate-dependent enzyme [Streptomyces sp. 3MP-14]
MTASAWFPQSSEVGRNARPFLHGPEFDAVAQALRDGQYGHGEVTEAFEGELASFLGVSDVVAVSSGTAALEIALLLAGVGPGDEVVVPSQTFCATVRAVRACGATPRFADISPDSLCVDADTVREALTPATRVVLPVLYGGRAVDLAEVRDELDDRGIVVVEDAAHAFGSRAKERRVGNTGVLTCFSFGPIKNLTSVEGGAVVPRHPQEGLRARRLRTLGIAQPQSERIRTTSYSVTDRGLRATLSSVHAAVGRVQLRRFATVEEARKALWRAYATRLAEVDGVGLVDVDVVHSVPFNCVVRVPERDGVHAFMRSWNIGVGVHYPPNHLQPAFAPWHRPLPATERTAREILSLPFHPAMGERAALRVVEMLERALSRIKR